jgi:hypothetical protein
MLRENDIVWFDPHGFRNTEFIRVGQIVSCDPLYNTIIISVRDPSTLYNRSYNEVRKLTDEEWVLWKLGEGTTDLI